MTGSVVQAGSVGQIHYHLHDYQEASAVPAQLPRSPEYFTSRERELADLSRWQRTEGDQPPLIVISGPAGVGKTTLSLHWLRGVRDQFPDGQLYVDLGGFSTREPVDPADVLEWFLAALGLSTDRVPSDLGGRSALYRSVTEQLAMAVLLDNAASAAQVRPLLPAGRNCVVAVTSRWRLTGLAVDGAGSSTWIHSIVDHRSTCCAGSSTRNGQTRNRTRCTNWPICVAAYRSPCPSWVPDCPPGVAAVSPGKWLTCGPGRTG
ncbi:MAG TPA: AAA family ATPase [Pseudonocardiaceae bacterium]|nr:AAA family ATPase [Pseudonocardiaceae bacterium]